jgi:hypothetical protein
VVKVNPSIEKRLIAAQIAITNLRTSPELQIALATYGYTAERISQGEMLHNTAKMHYQQKITAYGGLRTSADALNTAEQQAQEQYIRHIKLARLVLENDHGALQALHLIGKRKLNLASWLVQAQQFYTAALQDGMIMAKLAAFGLNVDELQIGAQRIEDVTAQYAARYHHKGLAQQTTRVRNQALSELDTWMRDLKVVARIALRDCPQLLEQLGMLVRS